MKKQRLLPILVAFLLCFAVTLSACGLLGPGGDGGNPGGEGGNNPPPTPPAPAVYITLDDSVYQLTQDGEQCSQWTLSSFLATISAEYNVILPEVTVELLKQYLIDNAHRLYQLPKFFVAEDFCTDKELTKPLDTMPTESLTLYVKTRRLPTVVFDTSTLGLRRGVTIGETEILIDEIVANTASMLNKDSQDVTVDDLNASLIASATSFYDIPKLTRIEGLYTDSSLSTQLTQLPTSGQITLYPKTTTEGAFFIINSGQGTWMDAVSDCLPIDLLQYFIDSYSDMNEELDGIVYSVIAPAGCDFDGLYADSDFTTPFSIAQDAPWPTENVEVFVKYRAGASITFAQTDLVQLKNDVLQGMTGNSLQKLLYAQNFEDLYRILVDNVNVFTVADGYGVEGIYTDANYQNVWNEIPTQDVTLYVKVVPSYKVTLQVGEGKWFYKESTIVLTPKIKDSFDSYQIFVQEYVTRNIKAPLGKRIEGLYLDANFTAPLVVNEDTPFPQNDVTIYVKYAKSFVITFIPDEHVVWRQGGNKQERSYSDFVDGFDNEREMPFEWVYGSILEQYRDEVAPGFELEGLYLDKDFVNRWNSAPTSDMTVYVKTQPQRTITVVVEGGTFGGQNPFPFAVYESTGREYRDILWWLYSWVEPNNGLSVAGLFEDSQHEIPINIHDENAFFPRESTTIYALCSEGIKVTFDESVAKIREDYAFLKGLTLSELMSRQGVQYFGEIVQRLKDKRDGYYDLPADKAIEGLYLDKELTMKIDECFQPSEDFTIYVKLKDLVVAYLQCDEHLSHYNDAYISLTQGYEPYGNLLDIYQNPHGYFVADKGYYIEGVYTDSARTQRFECEWDQQPPTKSIILYGKSQKGTPIYFKGNGVTFTKLFEDDFNGIAVEYINQYFGASMLQDVLLSRAAEFFVTKEGYGVVGVYTDSACTQQLSQLPSVETTLYLKVDKVDAIKLVFDKHSWLRGENDVISLTYHKYVKMPFTRLLNELFGCFEIDMDYAFAGFYTDSNYTKLYSEKDYKEKTGITTVYVATAPNNNLKIVAPFNDGSQMKQNNLLDWQWQLGYTLEEAKEQILQYLNVDYDSYVEGFYLDANFTRKTGFYPTNGETLYVKVARIPYVRVVVDVDGGYSGSTQISFNPNYCEFDSYYDCIQYILDCAHDTNEKVFDGLYLDEKCTQKLVVDKSTPLPTKDVTIYVGMKSKPVLTLILVKDEQATESKIINDQITHMTFQEYLNNFVRDYQYDLLFEGAYLDKQCQTPYTQTEWPTQDTTLYVNTMEDCTFTVMYRYDNGSIWLDREWAIASTYGGNWEKTLQEVALYVSMNYGQNYVVEGFYYDEQFTNRVEKVQNGDVIYAKARTGAIITVLPGEGFEIENWNTLSIWELEIRKHYAVYFCDVMTTLMTYDYNRIPQGFDYVEGIYYDKACTQKAQKDDAIPQSDVTVYVKYDRYPVVTVIFTDDVYVESWDGDKLTQAEYRITYERRCLNDFLIDITNELRFTEVENGYVDYAFYLGNEKVNVETPMPTTDVTLTIRSSIVYNDK